MFAAGETVRVKDAWPEATGPVHIRTPHYVRGVVGEVVRHLGDFPNPEDLAFARPADLRPLYHIRFRKDAIWPKAGPNAGSFPAADPKPGSLPKAKSDDELLIEIYEHWLERP